MFRKIFVLTAGLAGAYVCLAQQASPPQQPPVKVHMLNVCAPSEEEQQEIASALSHVPKHPSFGPDFEVDRGRSVLDQNANLLAPANNAPMSTAQTSADFVRMRRDFSSQAVYSNVQYSFSRDSQQMVETLVFRVREPKDLLQVAIEDNASSVTSPAAMLGAATPASRIKLERFGKSSVVLARCPGQNGGAPPDQSAYQPLFSSASSILSDYRTLIGAKRLVPEELVRIDSVDRPIAQRKSAAPSHHK